MNLSRMKVIPQIVTVAACFAAATPVFANPIYHPSHGCFTIVPVLILWLALAVGLRLAGRKIRLFVLTPGLVAAGFFMISAFFSMREALVGFCQVYLAALVVRLAFQEPHRRDPDWRLNLGCHFIFWLAASIFGESFILSSMNWDYWQLNWRMNVTGLILLAIYPFAGIAFLIFNRWARPRRQQVTNPLPCPPSD